MLMLERRQREQANDADVSLCPHDAVSRFREYVRFRCVPGPLYHSRASTGSNVGMERSLRYLILKRLDRQNFIIGL